MYHKLPSKSLVPLTKCITSQFPRNISPPNLQGISFMLFSWWPYWFWIILVEVDSVMCHVTDPYWNLFSQNGILLFLGHSINNPPDSATNLSENQQVLPYRPCQAMGNSICYPCGKYPSHEKMTKIARIRQNASLQHDHLTAQHIRSSVWVGHWCKLIHNS